MTSEINVEERRGSMKYCPECEAEYRDDIQECSDCQVPLISAEVYGVRKQREQEERERLTREEFVPVKVAESAFEADRVRAVLEQEGLTVMIRTFEDTAYDGIYVAQKGWGYVEVPRAEKEQAERIVSELERAFSEE
jgi:hypothetical protein